MHSFFEFWLITELPYLNKLKVYQILILIHFKMITLFIFII